MTEDEIITTAETAAMLATTTKTVRRMVEKEGLPAFRLGRRLRMYRSKVNIWAAARQRPTTSPVGDLPTPAHDSPSGKSAAVADGE